MTEQDAIRRAAEIAYEQDAEMVIGTINGEWAIAHEDDVGRIAEMSNARAVDSTGLIEP